jgi:phosphoribosylaminoimidazole-succinocarboxamide synthase
MVDRNILQTQLHQTLSNVYFAGFGDKYQGKVRDCFLAHGLRILVTTDRLSAFDVVLTTIPFKGELLNATAHYWFEKTKHIARNHLIDHPHPNVFVTEELSMLPVEVIVRRHLTGSAWRDYQAGKEISGVRLPTGLTQYARFPEPILTPSTKAEQGIHDEPISEAQVLEKQLADKPLWEKVRDTSLRLFKFAEEESLKRGLILVDTKYEFGVSLRDGELVVADEIHTPDSSRYWLKESYDSFVAGKGEPLMLDKEFFRGYLLEKGYSGNGRPPEISDEVRIQLAERYIKLFEQLTGELFMPKPSDTEAEVIEVLQKIQHTL